jgi:uncharacterized membrane protein YgdD (TMEM256/DUF423 family)
MWAVAVMNNVDEFSLNQNVTWRVDVSSLVERDRQALSMGSAEKYGRATNEEDTSMTGRSPAQRFLVLGSIIAGLGVAAGAFGAHALKEILEAPMLQVFETATRYVMYHAVGLCIVSWAIDRYPEQRLEKSGWLFILGILLFSGSLYVVSLAGIRWVGAVTPIGGLAFMAGWGLLGWGVWRAALPRSTSRTP